MRRQNKMCNPNTARAVVDGVGVNQHIFVDCLHSRMTMLKRSSVCTSMQGEGLPLRTYTFLEGFRGTMWPCITQDRTMLAGKDYHT